MDGNTIRDPSSYCLGAGHSQFKIAKLYANLDYTSCNFLTLMSFKSIENFISGLKWFVQTTSKARRFEKCRINKLLCMIRQLADALDLLDGDGL